MRLDGAPLPREFYAVDALRLARALLGKVLVHRSDDGLMAARIVEVEAYRGPDDRAAHSAGGRRTARNETMWGAPGRLYVYFVYGMHHCANVVAAAEGRPEAVLLRGFEPLAGLEAMRRRRGREVADGDLLRGPGVACRTLGLDRRHDGEDLVDGGLLTILDADPVPARVIERTPRIGVDYAGDDARLPWRLFIRGAVGVSGPRTAAVRPRTTRPRR